jgi:hypothetical protein
MNTDHLNKEESQKESASETSLAVHLASIEPSQTLAPNRPNNTGISTETTYERNADQKLLFVRYFYLHSFHQSNGN